MISYIGLSCRRLWGSISFRLTLNYGLLAILTTLTLVVFIDFQVMDALRTQYYRQINISAQRLAVVYEEGGRLRTAQRPGQPLAEVLQATQFCIDEIESLNVLFGKLLQIAEIEAGVQRQAFRPCRLDIIAADVVDMYETFAEEKGLSLSLRAPEPATIHGDPNLLASALANLVDNAVKYARTQVHVEVISHTAGKAGIMVRDDGPGLPASEHSQVGKHFYRCNPDSEGYGLGPTSVLAIVEPHNGDLLLFDNQPGLKVVIYLPT